MITGTVAHIVYEKGYGFIQSDAYEKSIFFHASKVQGVAFEKIKAGDTVLFAPAITTNKGESTPEVRLA